MIEKSSKAVMAAGLVGLLSISTSALAVSPNASFAKDSQGTIQSAFEHRLLAENLAKYGEQHGDVHALIESARILKSNPVERVHLDKSSEGGPLQAEVTTKLTGENHSVASLLSQARELAGERSDLLAMIDDVEQFGLRGRIGGSVEHEDRVKAEHTDVYRIKFKGDRKAMVYVDGDGDTDLDLYVYDENDNLVCSDTDSTDTMLCQWTPSWTGEFTVKIRNWGSVYNVYTMSTN